jgi:hypothetical protein
LSAFGVHLCLNFFPDVIAGLVGGLEEETSLVGDVLEIANQGGAVFAGLEVIEKCRVFRNTIAAGCEEVRKLFLKLGTC